MVLTNDEVAHLEMLLAALAEVKSKLDDKSRTFIEDQEARYDKFGADIWLTTKQWQYLESLYDRYA